jgi:glucose/arabinose dehydrogenase
MKRLLAVLVTSVLALVACASPVTTGTPAAPTTAPDTQAAPTGTVSPVPATPAANATETIQKTAVPQATASSQASATPTAIASTSPVTNTAQPGAVDPARYAFTAVAQGFHSPVLVTNAGDGTGRLFVVEQGGAIQVVQSGAVLPQPFIDLSAQVTHGGSEEGLLGLAFDPQYAQSGQFYVYFTDPSGNTHVVRYHVSASDPNQADAGSAQELLRVQQPPYPNHKGGNIVFGPDGYLYVSLGDGGSQGDPNGNGQKRDTLLGKILRLDVSGGGNKYSIPPTNPFVGQSGIKGEIWAYGLRNPWRATFDRATGDFWIGDVGQNTYEEVDLQPAGDKGGENYGWNFMEGLHPYKGQAPAGLALVPPVAEYTHQEGGCAITGGYVYRGPGLPELNGVYFLGDYCSGITWTLTRAGDQWQKAKFISTSFQISSFGEDEAGELYVCDYGGGVIYRLARAR